MFEKGLILAGYRIEAVIGRGDFGIVYEATQLGFDRSVALKILDPHVGGGLWVGSDLHERFQRQAVIDHPHLLTVFEAGSVYAPTGQVVYLAMPFVDGPNLKELIVARSLDFGRTLHILSQVAEAMDAMHAAGLDHGDVKPQNVHVAGGDHAYLAALGMRPTIEQLEDGIPWSIDYFSPDQITGSVRPAEDIYALTAVLYECLTGVVPFARETVEESVRARVSEDPPSVSGMRPQLPRALDDVIARGMDKDPYARFLRAGDLLQAAEAAIGRTSPGRVGRPGLPPSPPREDIKDAPAEPRPAGSPEPPEAESAVASLTRMLREGVLAGVVPERGAPPTAMAAQEDIPAAVPDVWPSPATEDRSPTATIPSRTEARRSRGVQLLRIGLPLALLGGTAVALKWLFGFFGDPGAPADPSPDTVECTVFAPPAATPGDSLLVQAFVHLPEQSEGALALAREFDIVTRRRTFRSLQSPVRHGSRIDFELRMPGLQVDDPVASLVWRGRTDVVQFGVDIPAGAPERTVIGTLEINLDAAPLGHVKFKLTVDKSASKASPEPQGEDARRYTDAFISYASKDRNQVLERVQMLPAVGIRYFQDVLSLEPGDRWARKLELGIRTCDLFLLFWSKEAKQSEWVRREVQYALARSAEDELSLPEIRPVILEGPPIVEPWEELADLHFNDRLLYFMRPSRVH